MRPHYSESEPEPLSPLYAGVCDHEDCPLAATHGVGRMRLCHAHADSHARRHAACAHPRAEPSRQVPALNCPDCGAVFQRRAQLPPIDAGVLFDAAIQPTDLRAADLAEGFDAADHIHLWVELARTRRELRGLPISLQKCGDCEALRVLVGTEIFPLYDRHQL